MAPGAMGLPYGLQAMLKEGHKHFAGVDEAVMRNIEACKNLAQITRTSLGPNGASRAAGTLESFVGFLSFFLFKMGRRHEQDGDQPLGAPVCDKRRLHHRHRAGGEPPSCQAAGARSQGPGGRDWGRHQPGEHAWHAKCTPARACTDFGPPEPMAGSVPSIQLRHELKHLFVRACSQVLTLGGELLGNAEGLLRDGLHTAEVADGYAKAAEKVGLYVNECMCGVA